MQCTDKQAFLIGAKLYTQTKNQKHCEAWVAQNVPKETATKMLGKLLKLTYNLATGSEEDKAEYTRIQTWGREQIKALGYTEAETNRAN